MYDERKISEKNVDARLYEKTPSSKWTGGFGHMKNNQSNSMYPGKTGRNVDIFYALVQADIINKDDII